jgi:sodium-coupled neutral amino acid transporter 11
MFIMAYGAMVAYLLIIKDTVPTLLFNIAADQYAGLERELVLIGTSLVIVLPLSMSKDMSSLAFTSTRSVAADILLVIFILLFSPFQQTVADAGGFIEVLKQDSVRPAGLFIGLGVLSTAMACQHSAFIISNSLYQLTRNRWSIVTGFSISIATLLCATLGATGYLGFMDNTQGDVLNNFEVDSLVANAARALLAFTMFFTYPMEGDDDCDFPSLK